MFERNYEKSDFHARTYTEYITTSILSHNKDNKQILCILETGSFGNYHYIKGSSPATS